MTTSPAEPSAAIRSRAPEAAFAAAIAGYLALYCFSLEFEVALPLVTGVLFHLPMIATYLLVPFALRRTAGRERLAWLAFALLVASWDAAEWVFSLHYLVLGDDAAFPGIADAFYYIGYGACFVAIPLAFWRRNSARERAIAIDSAIVAVVLGASAWQFVIIPNVEDTTEFAEVVLLGYPLMGLVLTSLIVAAFAGQFRRMPPAAIAIAAGIACTTVTDSWNTLMYTGLTAEASFVDVGWLAGYWCFAFAFLFRARQPADEPAGAAPPLRSREPILLAAAPYAAFLPLAAFTVADALGGGAEPTLAAGSLVSAVLIMVRQWLTLGENHRLYRSLEARNEELAEHARSLDALRAEAVQAATHDGLTGVLTRRAWFEAAYAAPPAAVALLDIDHFKRINDTFGHPAGDDVLRQVAGRMAMLAGPGATVGRLGGEEFGILLLEASSAELSCDRLVGAFRDAPLVLASGDVLPVTVSIGLVFSSPNAPIDALYAAADSALYEAKRAGRARLVVAPSARAA
ncbi:MAG: GGDEF domain-containing protein [Dehalococcoidia bacterium]|nr:GGDEF domain-containing protein [Dehalococcoidia bacterium]